MQDHILKHFEYSHPWPRPHGVRRASRDFVASSVAALPDGPEKDMRTRKLLEARDGAVHGDGGCWVSKADHAARMSISEFLRARIEPSEEQVEPECNDRIEMKDREPDGWAALLAVIVAILFSAFAGNWIGAASSGHGMDAAYERCNHGGCDDVRW